MKYIAVLCLGFCLTMYSQDPLFTNNLRSLVSLNPSFAGSNGLIRYQSITRNQWYHLSQPYLTFYNSFDAYIKPLRGGFALTYIRDDQLKGTLVTDRVDLTYAQHLSLLKGKLKIIPSIQISGFQKKLDYSKLTFGDQIDPRRGFTQGGNESFKNSVRRNIDLSSGLIVNYNHFYVGVSVFHITQPEQGLQSTGKLPHRLSVFASYNFRLGEHLLLNGLYRFEKQQNFFENQFAVNLLYKHLILNVGFGSNNLVSTSMGFRHNYFIISGGYEFGLSGLNTACTYELSASYTLRKKENRKLIKDFERW